MFSEMIEMLKREELPSPKELQARLQPAIVKKNGVLQQPRQCWSNDPKINPNSTHLLWAAILQGDQEIICVVTGMIFVEQGHELVGITTDKAKDLILEKGLGLLALASTTDFKNILTEKINVAASNI